MTELALKVRRNCSETSMDEEYPLTALGAGGTMMLGWFYIDDSLC